MTLSPKLRNIIVGKPWKPHLRQLPAGGNKLCPVGRIYRFQKIRAGGQMRWKCINAERNSKCIGYAVTDGEVPGPVILRAGEHAPHCEPIASTKDVATIRHAVISTAVGSAGATPVRAVAECLGGAGNSVMRPLPTSGSLKRSAHGRRLWSTAKPGILGITTP